MASKLGKALGYSMDLGADDEEAPVSEELDVEAEVKPKEKTGGSAEVLAMKQFERATTPEAKVQALKDFGEACGWTSGSY